MMRLLLVILLFIQPAMQQKRNSMVKPSLSVIQVESDMIMGNTLPQYGTLCEDVNVQGDPYLYTAEQTIYTLKAGETVRLREQGGEGRSWVMIGAARWIPGRSLCGWSK